MKLKVLSLLFLLSLQPLFAISTCSLSSSGGLLDIILQDFYAPTAGWRSYLYPIALKMYWFWFTAELLYQITFKKVLANDMQKLWYFLTIRVFTGYMFATIFVDPAFYTGIITYFVQLGGQAGNFNITPNSGNPFASLSPSAVMDTGGCVWNSAWTAVKTANLGITDVKAVMTAAFPIILMTLTTYVLAAIMAFTLFMTALEGYIVMNAGVILLGFAGSSWTQGFWNKYLSYVGGIAIRLFVMCLILGLIKTQLLAQLTDLSTATASQPSTAEGLVIIVGSMLKFLISFIIFTFLVVKVPAMAGSMLTGTVNSGLGDVIQGAAMMLAGAGLAKGLAKMGINMAGGSGGSENSTKEKFKDTLRGPGGGGIPSGGSKGGSTGATKTDSQTAKSAMSPKDKAKAIADLCGVSTEPAGGSGGSDSSIGGGGSSGGGSSESSSSSSGSGSSSSSGGNTASGSSGTSDSQSSGSSSSSSGSGSSSSNSTPSGGMSGNDDSGSSGNKSASKPTTKDEAARKEKNAAIIKDMIKNKDSLIRSAKQMASNSHAGAADLNINPHKHD